MIIRAGDLRNRVTLQQKTESTGDQGEPTVSWADWKTIWAQVRSLDGREFWQAQQVNSEITGEIRMRYISGVTNEMRAVHGSDVYDILAIIPSEKKDSLTLKVKKNGTSTA